jgi:hypothetical protein
LEIIHKELDRKRKQYATDFDQWAHRGMAAEDKVLAMVDGISGYLAGLVDSEGAVEDGALAGVEDGRGGDGGGGLDGAGGVLMGRQGAMASGEGEHVTGNNGFLAVQGDQL